jgi:hypothetical protein
MRLLKGLFMINSNLLIEELDSEFSFMNQVSLEIKQLEDARNIISQLGVSSSSVLIMKSMGLLSSTSFDSIALESLNSNNDNFKNIALEELDTKISDKQAGWSAKLLSFVKSVGSKTLDILNPIWEKITGVFKKAGSFVWDKAESVGKAVKAHPYKTIMVVILAIAAVAGILAYCGSFLPGSNQGWAMLGKFDKKLAELASKIKLPWGSVKTTAGNANNLNRIDVVFAARKAENIPIEKLGWSQASARTCYTELSKAVTSVKSGLGSFVSRGVKVLSEGAATVGHATVPKVEGAFKSVGNVVYNHTGSKTVASAAQMVAGGAFFWGAVNIFHKVWRLIKKIVIGGLKMIYSSIKYLFDFS